ncbi:alpha/beta fold hydrolase [Fodinicola acaciae]|uniref:alpha/beta fold hydrolase n=1 Tax=Fodinicola acaciae TaxID=2681555 RepID=UPI0013D6DA79|nr:alpha/beta hydrolase [Fodinicola acaciae]
MTNSFFDGFDQRRITTSGAEINVRVGGAGPPVLLLHGFPQTHAMWHEVAPRLATDHTVVVADLRGYGDSSTPPAGDDHAGYSFRAMARDQYEVMRQLGHPFFAVVGHDRGARTAHRLALDHAEAVTKLAVLDIAPTRHVFSHTDKLMASTYYHWFFLIQPYDLPERLIGNDAKYFLHSALGSFGGALDAYDPRALAEYERCFDNAETRHAMIEDYRAAASIDLEHDEADADRRLSQPTLVLWGETGAVGRMYEPLEVWRDYADDVRGRAIADAGHFLVEQQPADVLAEIEAFL